MKISSVDLEHDLVMWGNAFIEVTRGKAGEIVGMKRLHPPSVALDSDKKGVKGYRVITIPGDFRIGQDILAHLKHVKQGEFNLEIYGGPDG